MEVKIPSNDPIINQQFALGAAFVDPENGEPYVARMMLSQSLSPTDRQTVERAIMKNFTQDTFAWRGDIRVPPDAYFNFDASAFEKFDSNDAHIDTSSAAFKFPAVHGKTQILISVKISGTVGGENGRTRQWYVLTSKPESKEIISSIDQFKVIGNSVVNREVTFVDYTSSENDSYTNSGFLLGLKNDSGANMTINQITLCIQRIVNNV
jgi:hypothetical protein